MSTTLFITSVVGALTYGLMSGLTLMLVVAYEARRDKRSLQDQVVHLQWKLAESREEAAYWRYECDEVLEEFEDFKRGAMEC